MNVSGKDSAGRRMPSKPAGRAPQSTGAPGATASHAAMREGGQSHAAAMDWQAHDSNSRTVLIVIASVCVVMFLHYAKDMLIPLVAALVIAACLGPVTNQLRRLIPFNSVPRCACRVIRIL